MHAITHHKCSTYTNVPQALPLTQLGNRKEFK